MTPDSETLVKLAAQCEAATENDVHLFRDVGNAVFGKLLPPSKFDDGDPQYSTDDIAPELWQFEQFLEAGAFLDAAMTLVPEGADFTLDRITRDDSPPPCHAHLRASGASGYAATPALAFCAASLRARAAK